MSNENKMGIDRTNRAPSLNKSHHDGIKDNTLEDQSLNHTKTTRTDKNAYVAGKIIQRVTKDGVRKYVVRWYGSPLRMIPLDPRTTC